MKLKRDAETASDEAKDKAALFEKAMEVRTKLNAREAFPAPGCIKAREKAGMAAEDAVNICCLKLKRDAEAAATAAAGAHTEYAEMLAYA